VRWNIVKRLFIHGQDGIKLLVAMLMSWIYRLFNKDNIYLIGERKDQCQDNGYHFFKYIRENYSSERVYYCITKNSNQLIKINSLGNIVHYKSLKHYMYYLLADKLVCAHVGSCTPDTPFIWRLEKINKLKKKRIFIQHGITKELIPTLMYKETKANIFICGAKPEYDFVVKNFGYYNNGVRYLGFCRFDNLYNFKNEPQILVMPTWRQWFGMNGNHEISSKEFLNSQYFKIYKSLINSTELNDVLKKKRKKVIFYPHHEMQRYLNLFETTLSNVIIANEEDYDVQNLLKTSELLITDYSSIAFDFAYMRKPVIYYQFDKEKYYRHHYKKGYFDYERDGFGPIVTNEDMIIKYIKNGIDHSKYLEREKNFFELYDSENCKRHYEVMKEDF
jgi:CDP-glycerol glycerophosphotransferase